MGLDEVVFEKNPDSHTNEKRTVIGLFSESGEKMKKIGQTRIEIIKNGNISDYEAKEFGAKYGIIGSGQFIVKEGKDERNCFLETGDRLYVPAGLPLSTVPTPGSGIISALEEFEFYDPKDPQKDDRIVLNLSNEEPIGIKDIKQVRLVKTYGEFELGNHWRTYEEKYGVIGSAEFVLENIESRERESHDLKNLSTISVPKKTALKVIAQPNTYIMCASESLDLPDKTGKRKGTRKYVIE